MPTGAAEVADTYMLIAAIKKRDEVWADLQRLRAALPIDEYVAFVTELGIPPSAACLAQGGRTTSQLVDRGFERFLRLG